MSIPGTGKTPVNKHTHHRALMGLIVKWGRDIKPHYYKNSAAFCIRKERNGSIKLGKWTLINRSGKTSLRGGGQDGVGIC